ncbi:DUF748 domain-containing protein [Pontiella sulfatireligans]|uniref:Uncharacterized protein n=1 Tax=Pontiella sulfatireligans TaxID=2750658 RepID=A0A6C2ULK8_9BACT|nr:AsmA family protein [Pontiella sulfatireligans]VGO20184.1 hypothetical protein SCARR_02245 [Pontiella sulfatireligans]
MKAKRILGISLAAVFLILIALGCAIQFWLGPTLKQSAQRIGSKALGTSLAINELRINPFRGTIQLSGFSLANQGIFTHTNAASAASAEILLNMPSLLSQNVIIKKVRIERPQVTFESNTNTYNLGEFIKSARAYKPSSKKTKSKNAKQFTIQSVEITAARITVAHTEEPLQNLTLDIEQATGSMADGSVRFTGLQLSNPERISSTNLFSVAGLDIALEPDALRSARFHILDAQFRSPRAHMLTSSNTQGVKGFTGIIKYFVGLRKSWKATHQAQLLAKASQPASMKRFQLHNVSLNDFLLNLTDPSATNAAAKTSTLVSAGNLTLQYMDNTIQATNLALPNPSGFTATNLFHLASIDLEIEPHTLFSKHIVINQMKADSPVMHLQQTEERGNLSTWEAAARSLFKTAPPAAVGPPPQKQKHVAVENLQITNCVVTLALPETIKEKSKIVHGWNQITKMISLQKINPLHKYQGSGYVPCNPFAFTLLTFAGCTSKPTKGLTEIHDIYLGNLKGFSSPKLAHLNLLKIKVDPASKLTGTLIFTDVLFDSPTVFYERGFQVDNIKAFNTAIQQILTLSEETQPNASSGNAMPGSVAKKPGKKIIIDHLLVQNGTVRAKLSKLPTAPIPLPNIELHNIGKEEGGLQLRNTFSILGNTFYHHITSVATSASGLIGDTAKGIVHLPGDAWDFITGKDKKEATPPEEAPEKEAGEYHKNQSPAHHKKIHGRAF